MYAANRVVLFFFCDGFCISNGKEIGQKKSHSFVVVVIAVTEVIVSGKKGESRKEFLFLPDES